MPAATTTVASWPACQPGTARTSFSQAVFALIAPNTPNGNDDTDDENAKDHLRHICEQLGAVRPRLYPIGRVSLPLERVQVASVSVRPSSGRGIRFEECIAVEIRAAGFSLN